MAAHNIRIETVVTALTYAIALLAFAMVARAVGLTYGFIFLVLCAVALSFERRPSEIIPRWLLNLTAVVFVGIAVFRISFADPVTPVLQMLLLLTGIKLLEKKGFRDFMQIYLLAVFLLAGSALVSIDMDFLAALLVLMYLLSTAIIFLAYYVQESGLEVSRQVVRRMLSASLLIPTIAIPLSLLLFIVLPRSTFPLMTFLNRGAGASTGFSEEISLGEVAGIQEDASIAFRVEMPRIRDADLYWRGIVLETFDGRKWTRAREEQGAAEFRSGHGRSVRQVIYLEPYQNRYLFALDRPLSVSPQQAMISRDLTISLPSAFERRIRYEANSALVAELADRDEPAFRYRQLPDKELDQIRKHIHSLVGSQVGMAAATALAEHLRDSDVYTYSLTSLPVSGDPLHEFLFEKRSGNCEYFASALAVMLRLNDIPARLVGGYRGGYYSELGGYYAIPQKSAHVWVEAYFPGRGWIRFDPTPALLEAYSSAIERSIVLRMRMFMDSIQYAWNAFVINYDFEKQVRLFQSMGKRLRGFDSSFSPDRKTLIILGSVLAVVVMAGGYLRYLKHRKRPEERILEQYLAQLNRLGYPRESGEGLREMTSRIAQDDLRALAVRFAEFYQRCFYREGIFDEKALSTLKSTLNKIMNIQHDS